MYCVYVCTSVPRKILGAGGHIAAHLLPTWRASPGLLGKFLARMQSGKHIIWLSLMCRFQHATFETVPTTLAVTTACNSDLFKTTFTTCSHKSSFSTLECICIDSVGFSRRFCWLSELPHPVEKKMLTLVTQRIHLWTGYISILAIYNW